MVVEHLQSALIIPKDQKNQAISYYTIGYEDTPGFVRGINLYRLESAGKHSANQLYMTRNTSLLCLNAI